MKKKLTLFFVVILCSMAADAQDYADYSLEDESLGTIQALTSTDVEVTSAGFRGNAGDYNGRYAIVVGDLYFFTASTAAEGDELWVSDGTRDGTSLVMDIESGSGNSSPANFAAIDGNLYFSATTSTSGTELWVSDGTEAGTSQVLDLFEGVESGSPNTLTAFSGGLLFAAFDENSADYGDGIPRQHLWHYDISTQEVIRLSADNADGVVPKTTGMDAVEAYNHFQLIGDTLAIFGGTTGAVGDDGVIGEEIWVTNGMPEPWGTKMLLDINPSSDNSNIQWLLSANEEQVVFRAKTPGVWNGQPELTTLDNNYWVTDGTTQGTYPIQDLNTAPGADANTTANSSAAFPVAYGGKIVFRANHGTGTDLSIINSLGGEDANTGLLWDIAPIRDGNEQSSFPDDFIVFDDRLFFKANFATDTDDIDRIGQELGAYDVTTDERLQIADINNGATANAFPRNKTIVNGRMYMTAADDGSQNNSGIWALDIKGDGQDPAIDDSDDVSLVDDYIVYKIFEDTRGAIDNVTIKKLVQSDLRDLNGNLMFVTKANTLAIYDDGLEKTDESTNSDGIDDGLPVDVGSNDEVNAPPTVSLAVDGSEDRIFFNADPVVFTADAEDPDGEGVVRVEYYEGDFFNSWNLLGVGTSAEDDFAFTWTAIPADDPQTITALAYDANDSAFSQPIQILVEGNERPVVVLAAPSQDQELVSGSVLTISAEATGIDGAIESVEFFANDESIFLDEASPYGFEWTAPEELGDYVISAVATDELDATGTSATVTITIIEEPLSVRAPEEHLSIYPVPATKGVLNFQNNFGENLNVSITDLSGKSVFKTVINTGIDSLTVDKFEAGIYSIRVERPSTNEIFTYKVVFE